MIDLWIFDKFVILPTDERFLNLYEEQKLALFEGVCSLPDQDSLKKNVIISRRKEEIKNKKDSSFLSKGLQIRMKEQYEKSGLSGEQIREKIKEIIESKRQVELAELEKMANE